MKAELMSGMFSISLKARILREWQVAHAARTPEFSDREMLMLEIISDFGPVTEKELRTVFGLSPSFVNEMIGKLSESGLVHKERQSDADGRMRPLTLTPKGKQTLDALKGANAMRFEYLLADLSEAQQEQLVPILKRIGESAEKRIREMVFSEYV